jgi:parallel beta-helix repeat protein
MKRILVEGERIAVAGISLTLGLVLAAPAQAEICVNTTGSGDCYTSIQDAVAAAGKNGTVLVYPGTYFETVKISADGLTLKGVGRRHRAVIDPAVACPPDVRDCIQPDAPPSGVTVGAADVTIENLTIQNAPEYGIEIAPAGTGTKLSSVRVDNAGSDCILVQGNDTLVSRSRLRACGRTGIIVDAADVEIRDTSVEGTGEACVRVGEWENAEITNNHLSLCQDSCLSVEGAGTQIEGNWVKGCKDQGVDVSGREAVVHRNWISATGDVGVEIECFGTCEVTRNYVSDVAGDACFSVRLPFGDSSQPVEHNTGIRCAGAGFGIRGDGMVLRHNRAIDNVGARGQAGFDITGDNNVLESNLATGNGDGFRVNSGRFNTLRKNIAIHNLDDGFDVSSAGGTDLEYNLAKGNVAVGFEVSPRAIATTLMGNSAFKNRPGYDFCDAGIDTDPSDNHFGSEAVAPCPTE